MIVDIIYRGITLVVSGDYSPEEPEVRYYPDGSGYPGCGAEFSINTIFVDETDIIDLFSEEQIEQIRDMCFDKITTGDY